MAESWIFERTMGPRVRMASALRHHKITRIRVSGSRGKGPG